MYKTRIVQRNSNFGVLALMIYKCRIVSEQFHAADWKDFQIDNIIYSPRVSLDDADAVLALYDPSDELLAFEGPKLWFTMEPSWHHHFHGHKIGRKLLRTLKADERAFYAHPLPQFRVPHTTFTGSLSTPRESVPGRAAVATVTNFGGRVWFLRRRFRIRNRFILHPKVELFGEPGSWGKFRHFPRLWIRRAPSNFSGSAPPGRNHYDESYIQFLSRYKVAVCMENSSEPYYFTEKFVNAARAGCVPVYHAHPTVKERFLRAAKWVDPADFGWSSRLAIDFALSQPQSDYRQINDKWLQSGILADTDDQGLFLRLHRLLMAKISGEKAI